VYGRQAEGTANRPRSDEVTGFTRCSVLKVRVDTRDPRKRCLTSRREPRRRRD